MGRVYTAVLIPPWQTVRSGRINLREGTFISTACPLRGADRLVGLLPEQEVRTPSSEYKNFRALNAHVVKAMQSDPGLPGERRNGE